MLHEYPAHRGPLSQAVAAGMCGIIDCFSRAKQNKQQVRVKTNQVHAGCIWHELGRSGSDHKCRRRVDHIELTCAG